MILGSGRIPPGGWAFEVQPGVKLEAINKEELIKRIFEYRVRNNIPIGDIERDISDFYCSRWPTACHKEPADYGHKGQPVEHTEPMLNRVSRFASLLLVRQPKGGFPLIERTQAIERAKVCAGCSANLPWRVGCRGCSNNTAVLLAQLRKTSATPHDPQLNACRHAGWCCATAVWFPKQFLELSPSQKAALPVHCWAKE